MQIYKPSILKERSHFVPFSLCWLECPDQLWNVSRALWQGHPQGSCRFCSSASHRVPGSVLAFSGRGTGCVRSQIAQGGSALRGSSLLHCRHRAKIVKGRTLGSMCWSSCRLTGIRIKTWGSFAVLSPRLCSHLLKNAPALAVLTWPPPAPGRSRTAATLILQTQHRGEPGSSPGFFRLFGVIFPHVSWHPNPLNGRANPGVLPGGEMQKQTLWAHHPPLLFLSCCALQIEAFILVLVGFQRKLNINKIATQVHFKCPWRHHYCCCFWKPCCCQRTPAQRDWATQCFTGVPRVRKQEVGRKLAF